MENMKIFGIGLNRTGTKTLGVCLRYLGYTHLSYDFEALQAFQQGKLDCLLEKIRHYDSCEDWPWPLIFEALDAHFPDAKFILTIRKSPDVWFESLCRHAERTGPTEARRLVYGYPMPHDYSQHHIDFYMAHNQSVKTYFQGQPKKLRVVCWENGDGWEQLCHFIGQPCPVAPFPHIKIPTTANATLERLCHNSTVENLEQC